MSASSEPRPIDLLRGRSTKPGHLSLTDFLDDGTVSSNTTGEKSQIAELELDAPVILRGDKDALVVITAHESFTTNGTAADQEQFDLSNDIIESPSAQNIAVWEGSSTVSPDAVDYDNDHFDYTDDGTNNRLDVFYVVGVDAANVEIERVSSDGSLRDGVFDYPLQVLHERDQTKNGFGLDIDGDQTRPILARDMKIRVSVDSSYSIKLNDSTNDVDAINSRIMLPVRRVSGGPVPGLKGLVERRMSSVGR